MFHWRAWLVIAMLFFSVHVVSGYLNCAQYMCPGDKEDGWVLEFKDEDTGEAMIKQHGRVMTKQDWLKEQQKDTR